ncbi:hypothetical protein fugu_018941 [Takifugu bimaculatus]|uniref:FIP-RBD domain-containing protein n=1 Tax=Takifugu bimaculatus TaxID=433685 RepID=A0A4Z2BIX8_9TELE|nr:hypothetical protein fugu_018941 [Takifugu bimaculatus]
MTRIRAAPSGRRGQLPNHRGKHQAPRGPQGSPPRADRQSTDIGTAPQKSFRATSPVGRSDPQNTSMHSSSVKVTLTGAKQGKGPAPSRPCPGARAPPTSNISHTSSLDVKQAPISYGLNPFEDDEDEDEANFDPTRWPPAAASSSKFKSSKKARAPPLPELCDTPSTSVGLNPGGDPDPAVVVPDNHQVLPCDPGSISEAKPVTPQGSGGKREEPPTTKRRLLPVKPLNPLRQAVNQGGKDIQAFGILSDDLKNTKGDLELKGPYSQLTKAELISLVLKQDNQLLEKDKKVSELEQYIDNLLVRVMEEQPSILMSMNTLKKSV